MRSMDIFHSSSGGFDAGCAAPSDVGVEHVGFDIFVAKEFLNGEDVVAVL